MNAEKFLCCFVAVALMQFHFVQPIRLERMHTEKAGHCVPIDEVPLCSSLGYDSKMFLPNFRKQDTPEEVNRELDRFLPLVATNCSNALLHLLCGVYVPFCHEYSSANKEIIQDKLPPCRNLCEYVREGCKTTMFELAQIVWPPGPHLNCSNYPEKGTALCFGPEDPSSLLPPVFPIPQVPQKDICDDIEIHVVGPSKATLIWTGLEASQETTNSSDGDGELTKESVPIIVSCNPKLSHAYVVTTKANSNTIELKDLKPSTIYNCTLNLRNSTIRDAHSCNVHFQTYTNLAIQVINDTPRVAVGAVEVEFVTTRNVSESTCQVLKENLKLDCTSGRVTFNNIAAGYQTIRITSKNSLSDRVSVRFRVRVPEQPRHCVVNLVNQLTETDGRNVTIWFKGNSNVDKIHCQVGRGSAYTSLCVSQGRGVVHGNVCLLTPVSSWGTSPLRLQLAKTEHKIKLIPIGRRCNKRSALSVTV